jgi:hypothetical protein
MADEPVTTSPSYDPNIEYIAPVGRLPVLGKVRAEVDSIRATILNEGIRTINDTTRATNDTNRSIAEIQTNADKTAAEVGLLLQKTETELAQVVDAVGTGTVYCIIGKQKALFQKQTDGFDRDAEQKLAKIMVDTWSVRQTTDGALAGEAGLAETDIAAVLAVAKAGIS